MPVAVMLGPMSAGRLNVRQEEVREEAKRYPELDLKLVDSGLPREDKVRECQDAVALIAAGRGAFDTDLIAELNNLRLIQTFSAGTDWIDKAALAELGVKVANNGGANAVAVAEHAVILMLSVERKSIGR